MTVVIISAPRTVLKLLLPEDGISPLHQYHNHSGSQSRLKPADQPFPFLCLKPCFAPAPFFLKLWLPFFPLDLNDLSFCFSSNFFFFAPNLFSLPPFFAPKVFPAGFIFFPNAFSPSLDFFHPLLAWPPERVLLPVLAPLSLPGCCAGNILFRFLALGNMSATKSQPINH